MSETNSEAGEQVYLEIHRVIKRFQQESDITGYQVVGALEAVKMDVMEGIKSANEGKE